MRVTTEDSDIPRWSLVPGTSVVVSGIDALSAPAIAKISMGTRPRLVPPRAPAGLGAQLLDQAIPIPGVARDTRHEIGVVGDEGQVEQLGRGLLLRVDPLLLVPQERRRLLHRVERASGGEGVIDDVE